MTDLVIRPLTAGEDSLFASFRDVGANLIESVS